MLFSSLMFLFLFLPASIAAYYLLGKKYRNIVLLMFSLFFYGYGEPRYLGIMLASISVNYVLGYLVDYYRGEIKKARLVVGTAVVANLLIIGYYKYADFFVENLNSVFNSSIPLMNVAMPIGISFFTFQGLSYIIDLYRGHGKVQKNPLNVALYISLFPQLIAGPIVRYETVSDQIEGRKETIDKFTEGIRRFIIGLSKKVLIANSMGLIADEIFSIEVSSLSVLLAWIGSIAYAGQVYFDFSGYSDMAIGLGKMFGFDFLENFNYPYVSKSITEFWRRWHISLSTWFRDYVYIPLGGNRVSKLKHLRNIFVVWFLTGLWHGAAWNFIAWGLYFGIILVIEKFFIGNGIKRLWGPLQHLYALVLIMVGWVLFRSNTLAYALEYIRVMFALSGQELVNSQAIYYLSEYRLEFIIAIVASAPSYRLLKEKLEAVRLGRAERALRSFLRPAVLGVLFLTCIMYLVNSTFNPFIYFRF